MTNQKDPKCLFGFNRGHDHPPYSYKLTVQFPTQKKNKQSPQIDRVATVDRRRPGRNAGGTEVGADAVPRQASHPGHRQNARDLHPAVVQRRRGRTVAGGEGLHRPGCEAAARLQWQRAVRAEATHDGGLLWQRGGPPVGLADHDSAEHFGGERVHRIAYIGGSVLQ